MKCIKNEKCIAKPIKNGITNTAWAYKRLTSK